MNLVGRDLKIFEARQGLAIRASWLGWIRMGRLEKTMNVKEGKDNKGG